MSAKSIRRPPDDRPPTRQEALDIVTEEAGAPRTPADVVRDLRKLADRVDDVIMPGDPELLHEAASLIAQMSRRGLARARRRGNGRVPVEGEKS